MIRSQNFYSFQSLNFYYDYFRFRPKNIQKMKNKKILYIILYIDFFFLLSFLFSQMEIELEVLLLSSFLELFVPYTHTQHTNFPVKLSIPVYCKLHRQLHHHGLKVISGGKTQGHTLTRKIEILKTHSLFLHSSKK